MWANDTAPDTPGDTPGRSSIDGPSVTDQLWGRAEATPPVSPPISLPQPPSLRLALLATLGGIVVPVGVAVVVALLLSVWVLPNGSRTAITTTVLIVVAVAFGLGAAVGVEVAWRWRGLPGSGPANFLPLRWWRYRSAHWQAVAIIEDLEESRGARSPESREDLLNLSRQLTATRIYAPRQAKRLARLAGRIGEHIGWSPEEQEGARLAALLHDIGMLSVPISAFQTPGALAADHAVIVRAHPVVGAALAAPFTEPEVAEAIRHHHEHIDGGGYPDQLSGDAVPALARLIAVVDTYDALVSHRPYRRGRSRAEAFEELREVSGTQLDTTLVQALIEVESRRRAAGVLWAGAVGEPGRHTAHLLRGSATPAAAIACLLVLGSAGWAGLLPARAGATKVAASSAAVTPAAVTATATPAPSPPAAVPILDAPPSDTVVPAPAVVAPTWSATPNLLPLVTTPKVNPTTPSPSPAPTATVPLIQALNIPTPSPQTNSPPPAAPTPTPSPSTSVSPTTAPSVSAIDPSSGSPAGGTQVTISGSNLTAATGVTFGPSPASSFTVNSDSSITATSPAGSGSVPLVVTTPGGSSPPITFTYLAPTVTGLSPSSGPQGGGTEVIITGTNFTGATSVTFGGTPADIFTVTSDTTIDAFSPPGSTGRVDVVVTTPSGTSPASPADRFRYTFF